MTELGSIARNYSYGGVTAVEHLPCDARVKILDIASRKYHGKQSLSGGVYFVESIKMNLLRKIVSRAMHKFVENIYRNFKTKKCKLSRGSYYDTNLFLHK